MSGGKRLEWRGYPLFQEPWSKTALLVVALLVLSSAAALGFGGIGYGLVALIVLSLSLSRYWFPTRYLLDEKGVCVMHLGRRRRYPWAQFRRIDLHRDGLFLSPFVRSSRLDSFRGVFLRFEGNCEEVVRFVRAHVASGSL